jgi:hypothetical protein
VAPPDDLPSPRETSLAYGTTGLAALVWIACVVPGVVLADATLADDLATPMARGALLILPALLLLITGPIAVLISGRPETLRSLLASGDAFVALFSAGVMLHARRGDTSRLVAAIGLLVLFAVAVRDAIRPAFAAPSPDGAPLRRGGGLRLALALAALLMPASLLTRNSGERASLLAPFAYVALSALGSWLARGVIGLRLTAALLLVGVSAHLAIAIRYAIEDAAPPYERWTIAGGAAFGFALVTLAVTAMWTIGLGLRLRRARA